MRRLTRRIGLFGGPAAIVSSTGVIKKPSVEASGKASTTESETPSEHSPPAAAAPKKGWFRRLFGSD